jgi:5-(carboxyamino)imidazole ribonucleotide synthase
VNPTVGIIGGGQLGRYLCEAAGPLGIRTVVMTPSRDDPAAPFADELVKGALDDLAAARSLVARVDVVTFEIESVGTGVLEFLARETAAGRVAVRPDPRILLLLQNKATQKRWLVEQELPTAPFRPFADAQGVRGAVESGHLPMPFVQKAQTGGYDGRGVHIVRNRAGMDDLLQGPCLVEDFVAHVAEIAVLVARGVDGELAVYDPVALRFEPEQHVLDEARSPAELADDLASRCRAIGARTVERLGGVGVFALELFLQADGALLVNEISPRVHNSGHLTIDACETSQFAQHLRAVAGLALGPVTQTAPAVMRNLLWRTGPGPATAVPAQVANSSARVYWYGKTDGRPWRKMGHLTALGPTVAAARAEADAACNSVLSLTRGACG